jgi:hypothetical protein
MEKVRYIRMLVYVFVSSRNKPFALYSEVPQDKKINKQFILNFHSTYYHNINKTGNSALSYVLVSQNSQQCTVRFIEFIRDLFIKCD